MGLAVTTATLALLAYFAHQTIAESTWIYVVTFIAGLGGLATIAIVLFPALNTEQYLQRKIGEMTGKTREEEIVRRFRGEKELAENKEREDRKSQPAKTPPPPKEKGSK
jgi:hypothetical protein